MFSTSQIACTFEFKWKHKKELSIRNSKPVRCLFSHSNTLLYSLLISFFFCYFFHVIPIESDKIERGEDDGTFVCGGVEWEYFPAAARPSAYQLEIEWQQWGGNGGGEVDEWKGILKISQLQDVLGILKQCLFMDEIACTSSSAFSISHLSLLYHFSEEDEGSSTLGVIIHCAGACV